MSTETITIDRIASVCLATLLCALCGAVWFPALVFAFMAALVGEGGDAWAQTLRWAVMAAPVTAVIIAMLAWFGTTEGRGWALGASALAFTVHAGLYGFAAASML